MDGESLDWVLLKKQLKSHRAKKGMIVVLKKIKRLLSSAMLKFWRPTTWTGDLSPAVANRDLQGGQREKTPPTDWLHLNGNFDKLHIKNETGASKICKEIERFCQEDLIDEALDLDDVSQWVVPQLDVQRFLKIWSVFLVMVQTKN